MRRTFSVLFGLGLSLGTSVFADANSPRALLKENRLEEAANLCRQNEPSERSLLVACAWAYLRSGRTGAGRALVEKIKKTKGETRDAELLEAFALTGEKKYGEAKQKLASVPQERGTPFERERQEVNAELYEAQGQNDTAAFLWRQAYSNDPSAGRPNWGLGRYHLAKGEFPRAQEHLEKAATAWPRHVGSRYNLAVLYLQQNKFNDAARWLAECYKLDRADPGVLEQMGVLFEKKNKIPEAVKYWERALAIDRNAPIAREKLKGYADQSVDGLIEKGDFEGALKKLQTMGKLIAQDPRLQFKRGLAYRFTGKYDLAAKDLAAYLKKAPNDAVAHRELGVCYLNKKLLAPAEKSFRMAIQLAPQDGRNYAWLGFLSEAKNDLPGAKEAWKKASELLTDPEEQEKASRRLSSVEQKSKAKSGDTKRQERERREKQKELEEENPEEALEQEDLFQQVPNRPGRR